MSDEVLGVLGLVGTAVLLPLLLNEVSDWAPWLAEKVIRWAARRLRDPETCARYEEEWIGNVRQVPGKLSRVAVALSLAWSVRGMRRSLLAGRLVGSFADQATVALEYEREIQERSQLARLEERQRIAKELHDGVIVMLYSTGLELQAIAQLATAPEPATGSEIARRAEAVIDRLDESIVSMRTFILRAAPGAANR